MSENRFEFIHGEQIEKARDFAEIVSVTNIRASILKDRLTGVLYIYTEGREGRSTMTPLLNPDGKPLIDKG